MAVHAPAATETQYLTSEAIALDPRLQSVQIRICRLVLYVYPVQARVTLLRRQGLRLRQHELQPPVEGDLTLTTGDGPRSSFRREGLCATLKKPSGASQLMVTAALPLFDVRIINFTGDVLTLVGIELDCKREGERWYTFEHLQVWRCALGLGGGESSRSVRPDLNEKAPRRQ